MIPHAHLHSLPPGATKGPFVAHEGRTSLETAGREAA